MQPKPNEKLELIPNNINHNPDIQNPISTIKIYSNDSASASMDRTPSKKVNKSSSITMMSSPNYPSPPNSTTPVS